ncbi:LTA synthase family protein [Bdellovibrio reynosensis]|uniref:Sulfatase n=1 Tax=Bdellovibrio reynosensis TaxID=2835041 RepID=A0ABY4C5H1_9BACT|nr:hypothetical protein [Bdellovibrio reynosensis]UOF00135.1 hypothetical protein MNR06_10520 [Bdellovibrio reynosensis]
MADRFIFSLRFSTKVFLKLAILSVAMILFMTLFRMNLYFLSVFHATANVDFIEIVHSFIAGLRFDILVFGFLFIPLYFLIIGQAITQKWPRWMFAFYKIYFGLAWFLICVLTFIDFFHFAKHGVRLRFEGYMNWTFDTLLEQAQGLQNNQTLIFCVITVMLFSLGYMLVKAIRFGEWKDEYSPQAGNGFEIFWRIALPLILIALAARGTVEPHHLRLEHSEVSLNKAVNEMALNAVWCFDK